MSAGDLSNWKNQGKSWFLGIGINSYTEFPNLTNAVRDVIEIKDLLIKNYDIDADCAMTLFDENANEENIIEKFDELGQKVGKEDKLIIYYSGHGRVNDGLKIGYWIPTDGKRKSSSRYILNSTIRDYIAGMHAKHILLISDACFSGSIFTHGDFRSTNVADELSDLPSRWALCSGRSDEEVYDGDPGGHSPFAQSLLNVLSSTKSDTISIGRIANHVIEETASNYNQLPDGRPMFGVGHGGGQYIFRKKHPQGSTSATQTGLTEKEQIEKPIDKKETIRGEFISTYTTTTTVNGETTTTTTSSNDPQSAKTLGFTVLGVFGIVAVMFIAIFYMASNSDNGIVETNINDTKTNQVTDSQGNTYPLMTIGNTQWTTLNLNYIENKDSARYFLNDKVKSDELRLGQLYSYQQALAACQALDGGDWTLPSVKDWELLAANLGYPLVPMNEGQAYGFQNELTSKLIQGGSAGLNLQFGGKYYFDNGEFTPSAFLKLNNGHYWTQEKRILNITQYAKETVAEITSTVPWNHGCSCRCVR